MEDHGASIIFYQKIWHLACVDSKLLAINFTQGN